MMTTKVTVLVVLSFALVLLQSYKALISLRKNWNQKNLDEKHRRFNVFKENVKYIHNFNKKDAPYKLKLNKFADMTNHEFKKSYAGSKVSHHRMFRGERKPTENFMYESVTNLPASVDWRSKGVVTPVKDQGQCGKYHNQIKTTKKLVSLSEQELVDCDNTENQGCNGGLMEMAFEYITKKCGENMASIKYAYMFIHGFDYLQENSHIVSIDGHQNVPTNDENALMKVVVNQPVSVAIDAGESDFQFYSEVKEGICGIAMEASYPIKTSANPSTRSTKRMNSSLQWIEEIIIIITPLLETRRFTISS
ncbi:hypothetical protein MKW92_052532 [Papaver armeniacum]|nr:hypothetical protein MKW92_052532 [Papaver armeniacum]